MRMRYCYRCVYARLSLKSANDTSRQVSPYGLGENPNTFSCFLIIHLASNHVVGCIYRSDTVIMVNEDVPGSAQTRASGIDGKLRSRLGRREILPQLSANPSSGNGKR